jgi:predicted dehydrogenase
VTGIGSLGPGYVHRPGYGRAEKALPIGVIGAGWIVRECHLPAYRKAGFTVRAIASRTPATAEQAAADFGIPVVYRDWHDLLDDPSVRVLDLAVPPDVQPAIIKAAAGRASQVSGILAQKPLAMDTASAAEIVRLCDDAGILLSVNQNMRYDQSIRALKSLLDAGWLGTLYSAQIVMHARVEWMPYAAHYARRALLIMSVHHLDAFRFLFGEPDTIMASARRDPLVAADHIDGYAVYVLEYRNGLRAVAIDNCLTEVDQGIEWRVEGSAGVAKGTIGWMHYPEGAPSTIDFTTDADPGRWLRPRWPLRWFSDGFSGTMGQLLRAIASGADLEISGADNLRTMALVDAAYASVRTGATVSAVEYLDHARAWRS